MKSWLCCIGLAAVTIFASAACGDDSDTPGGTAGTGGTGGTGGGDAACDPTGNSQTVICTTVNNCDKGEYMGTAAPVYTCNASKSTRYPDGPNACRNEADCAMINTPPVGIRDTVRTCAVGYRAEQPDPGVPETERVAKCTKTAELVTTCVRDATSMKFMPPGISDACGKCYIEIALCSSAFCLAECIADADAIDCIKCQFANGCRAPFEKCSGVDRQ
jgi:hypothetical protein